MGSAGRRGRRVCGGAGEPFWPANAGCRWAWRRCGRCIGWSRVLDPDCAHFHSRIAKIFLGFWRREQQVAEGARKCLDEGHQACRTKSRWMRALASEVRFSIFTVNSRTGRAQRTPSKDLFLRRPLSKAGTFICLQIGIWQGCQISRLFHEDAQGAQVIYLSILPG